MMQLLAHFPLSTVRHTHTHNPAGAHQKYKQYGTPRRQNDKRSGDMMAAFFPSTAPIWRISVANKRLKTQTSLANRHMYIYKFIQHMSVWCKCKQTKQAASYLVMPCYAMPCCAAPSMVIILRQSGVFINLSYAAIVQSTRRRRRKRGRSMSSKSQQQQC